MALPISPIGESSRLGAANAGTAMLATNASAAILSVRERRIHPPYGSRGRALLSNLEGALSIGVTGRDISLPQKVTRVTKSPDFRSRLKRQRADLAVSEALRSTLGYP